MRIVCLPGAGETTAVWRPQIESLSHVVALDLPNATVGHIADRNNTKLRWQDTKSDYCKGAKRKDFSAYHRALDREYCKSGYLFEPAFSRGSNYGLMRPRRQRSPRCGSAMRIRPDEAAGFGGGRYGS